ncbi:hypothetical protein CYY_002357 [Polysphondylium violaceum]|uniref:BTB domain-containing protein n=1 Tax=Polysphondylium violaceum TaxID=133409 RepID=A0A8J4UV86_9MYCE|nr:hypothetical protein CYY_002357 [Polysphondylium violaceum]
MNSRSDTTTHSDELTNHQQESNSNSNSNKTTATNSTPQRRYSNLLHRSATGLEENNSNYIAAAAAAELNSNIDRIIYNSNHQKSLTSSNNQYQLSHTSSFLDSLEYSSFTNTEAGCVTPAILKDDDQGDFSDTESSASVNSVSLLKVKQQQQQRTSSPISVKSRGEYSSSEDERTELVVRKISSRAPKISNRTASNLSLVSDFSSFDDDVMMQNLNRIVSETNPEQIKEYNELFSNLTIKEKSPIKVQQQQQQQQNASTILVAQNSPKINAFTTPDVSTPTSSSSISNIDGSSSCGSSNNSSLINTPTLGKPIQPPPYQDDMNKINLNIPNPQHQQQQNNTINNNSPTIIINNHKVDKSTPVNFNVGGTLFATSIRTVAVYPIGLLFKIVELQIELVLKEEIIFIDRNPVYFALILDFLRTGKYISPTSGSQINTKGLLQEAEFFRIEPLVQLIQNESELTRTDIIKMINKCYDYPRLRGLWLCRVNLSGLDLTCVNAEYSNLSECLFNSSLLLKANMVGCKLEKSSFKHSNISNANLSKAIISQSVLSHMMATELIAHGTDFSGSKLSGSVFSRSDFTGCNFRNAILDGCDFTNCNLSDADFSGSSLDEKTNFSGSNLKGAKFENSNLSVAKNKKSWKKTKKSSLRNKIQIPHI